jgi:phosphopantothenoylcysteine synthetase/decarboxylase
MPNPLVTLVVCGAPLTLRTPELLRALLDEGWQPRVVGTPTAQGWLDADAVETLTGAQPRYNYRAPTLEKRDDSPAALVVCPATFNTVNKAAAGAMDTYALGQICEALGMRLPTIVVPMVNNRLWDHPTWEGSLAAFRSAGAVLLDIQTGVVGAMPVASGTGSNVLDRFEPAWVTAQLKALLSR